MSWIWRYTATADDAVNLLPSTGAWATYYLKEALKQAGWVVKMSSDGTTYNAAGDQITTGASGANGMANASAWFRIQSPAGAGSRELTFQRTSNTNWRVKFSHSSGFTGGAPAATVTPSAADEQILLGGGTDAAPTFAALYGADGSYKQHIGTDNASPYGFFCLLIPNGGGALNLVAYVPLEGYPSADVAPYTIVLKTSLGCYGVYLSDYTTGSALSYGLGQSYYKKGLGGEAWVQFPAMTYYLGADQVPNAMSGYHMGQHPCNGKVVLAPIALARRSGVANAGWKGWVPMTMMAWRMSHQANGVTGTFNGLKYACFNDLAFIWPTSDSSNPVL